MVHNLPENFNISDFDVFHSALLFIPNRKTKLNSLIWPPAQQARERRILEEEGVPKARSTEGFPGSL